MQRYGSTRLTQDIDLAVAAVPQGVVGTALTFGGVTRPLPRCGIGCDYIVRADDYASLYEEALGAGISDARLPRGIRLTRREHLAAMKMAAGRDKDGWDLAWLILDGGLDLKMTAAVIRRHLGPYAVDAFRSDVEMARLERKLGRRGRGGVGGKRRRRG